MHTTYSTLLAFAALHFSAALPRPLAERPQPPLPDRYYVESQDVRDGAPFTAAVSIMAGGTLTVSEQYTFSTTIQVGANLDLLINKIIDIGLSASVQQTTSTSVGASGTAPCPPGPWTCALKITPSVLHIEGHKATGNIFGGQTTGKYTVEIPRVDSAKNAKIYASPCACHNRAGWAAAGAPPLCPSDCD